jgi:hypothetical protein
VRATRALMPKSARCHVIVDRVPWTFAVSLMGRQATPRAAVGWGFRVERA